MVATMTAAIPGASLDRPALQALLGAVRQRQIDVIVVYKVDRLTRSLADFAKLVELFDAHGVSFISITQSFNTTTSMGRLTLNMLLSFAQFEREVTGERIRDKIAASKKKGLWVGGVVPLGYKVVNRKLMIDEAEAAIVRLIFERYSALGSMIALMRELHKRGVVTRLRTLSTGRVIGGIAFTKGPLAYLLKNRMYLGATMAQRAIRASIRRSSTRPSLTRRRRSSRATPRPKAIPNLARRPCSSGSSTTTGAIG